MLTLQHAYFPAYDRVDAEVFLPVYC